MIARENLPNDTVELKGLVYQLLDVVEQQKLLIANQNERIEAQSQRIDQLTDQVNALKRHQFGKRSEKNQKESEKEKKEENEKTSSQDGYLPVSRVFLLGLHTRLPVSYMDLKFMPIGVKKIEGVAR